VSLPCTVRVVPTPVGPARVHVDAGDRATLVLGHGAGGGVDAPDLLAARAAALSLGWRVVRVEQPWRVRGARVAEAAARLDTAWLSVCGALGRDGLDGPGPLVVGGRSSGARVACRTAEALGAVAVLALAFPLAPPGRPGRTRLPELLLPAVPRLVVQGERDPFGIPAASEGVQVHVVAAADHCFAVRRKDGRAAGQVVAEVRETVVGWLTAQADAPQTET
jgi:predicted alpha/beta-hydrolase family hydrolase